MPLLDKALEYVRTPEAQHTANQWEQTDEYRHVISNMVYRMQYQITENSRYDREKETSVPYSWTLSWSIYTNSPDGYGGAKIAGQSRKVFGTKEEMEKYLNGRIKAYRHLFTEISPPIPKEYAEHFKVNGQLLRGYTIEGEPQPEQPPQEQAAPVFGTLPQEKQQELSDTVQANAVWQSLPNLDDAQAKKKLLDMKGIGEKVANCIMLFGLHRMDSYPRDVWVNRLIDDVYHGDFAPSKYAGFAGYVQQLQFYHYRNKTFGF